MEPISNYKELIQILNWNEQKRNNEGWYIFLVMNPRNQTNAGIDIIKNFSYLNVRTGNVTFFLPGFSNMPEGIVPYWSNCGDRVVYEDDTFGTLYFDERGFLDTIEWLEKESGYAYRYSEDLDLVIIKYHPWHTSSCADRLYEQNFDLQNMIIYNLDQLKQNGINAIGMITECMRVVSKVKTEREVKHKLENFISVRTDCEKRHWHHNINVFVAGAKVLSIERDAVISALSHIANNSSRDYAFRVKTYEDFDRSLIDEGRQNEYNDFISNDAEYAIFILDNAVGGITFEEFEVAMKAYKEKRKPEIFVYSRKDKNIFRKQSREVVAIRKHLSEIGQYYIEYKDTDDLKNQVSQDFRRYSL